MRIDVELKSAYGRLLKREPVFICDEVFKLNLITNYQMSEFIVVYRNGEKEQTIHHSNLTEIVIPNELVKEGVLNVKITLLSLGIAVKSWEIEPIVFKEVDGDLSAFTELEELRQKQSEDVETIKALTEEVSALSLLIQDLQGQIAELWQIQES